MTAREVKKPAYEAYEAKELAEEFIKELEDGKEN